MKILVVFAGLCVSWTMAWTQQVSDGDGRKPSGEPEAHSLLGKPLYQMDFPAERLGQLEEDLREARQAFEAEPENPERIIWLGRRTAYLSRYREAISIYSEGLEKHPDDPRLLRHRGHRYISVREFDKAVADLSRAAELCKNIEDEIEPDGQPNERNQPRSTLKSNIWYHLGLAHYLTGDFENALSAYLECMKYSTWNDDMLCAASDWLYMTYRRLGMTEKAQEALTAIHEDMEILENFAYHQRLLLYKGLIPPEELLDVESDDALDLATQGYGVGNWYLYNGQPEKARAIFEKVVAGSYWPAFGYIAAEAELARMSKQGVKK